MGKRKKAAGWKRLIIGMGVVIGTLFLATALMSLLIQKGILGTGAMHIGLIVCCLASGIAGAVYSGRGEKGMQSMLICLTPALAILLIAILGAKKADSITPAALHASSLLMPSVLLEAFIGGKGRKSGGKRKHRHMMRPK